MSSSAPNRSVLNRYIIPLAAMAIAFAAGWSLGASRQKVEWVDADVKVTDSIVTATVDNVTYTTTTELSMWIDEDGQTQTTGTPSCLTDGFDDTLSVAVGTALVSSTKTTVLIGVDCQK